MPNWVLADGDARPLTKATPARVTAGLDASGMTPDRAFSPGTPIAPYDGYSRVPRSQDFTTGINIAGRPRRNERVSFATLRGLVEAYDVARICIWHRIDSVRSLDWNIIAKPGINGDLSDEIDYARSVMEYPAAGDPTTPFHTWLGEYLFDVLAYDAGALYRIRNNAGQTIGLRVIDGTTLAPQLDDWGNRPEPPAPAYVQYNQGLPWNWLTTEDIIYVPTRKVANSPYGQSPLESILLTANTDLRLQLYFLQKFTEGNIPEAFATAPETWGPEQIGAFQEAWDAFLLGDQAQKNQIKWVPHGTSFAWSSEKDFSDELSLFLMRKTLASYHVVPADLGLTEDVNKACHSDDTETLTEHGWKHFRDVTPDERIATVNPETGALEYHVPDTLISYHHTGDMMRFKSRNVDVLVTPNHKMWAKRRRTGTNLPVWEKAEADTFEDTSYFWFADSAGWDSAAVEADIFVLPTVDAGSHRKPDRPIDMDLWLEFLGYVVSEGCIYEPNDDPTQRGRYKVSIAQSVRVNPEKAAQIGRCLDALPIAFAHHDTADGARHWQVSDKPLWTWLRANVGHKSGDKHLPESFRRLGKRQLTILFDALMLGDGSYDSRPGTSGFSYATSSYRLAGEMQEVAQRLGHRAQIGTGTRCWTVNMAPGGRGYMLNGQNVTREQYDGTVWCFTVKNHLFVTRRTGKIAIHGNSGDTQADVQFRIGDRPLINHVNRLVSAFLQRDLGLPLVFQIDAGREVEDRLATAQADALYIQNGVISPSEPRERIFGLSEPDGVPVPRYIFTARGGPIPLSALNAVAGPIDPETGAPLPGAPLSKHPFAPVEGVVPNPPPPVPPLAVQRFGPDVEAPPATPVPGPAVKSEGVTTATGVAGSPLIGPDGDEAADEADLVVAKAEIGQFRRFVKARHKAGTWRDFTFTALDPITAHRLNDHGRAAIRKATGDVVAAGLAVVAADTGRTLMLQRALDPADPAGGQWEFPGGHVETGEDPQAAAIREWCEETGTALPDGTVTGGWTSANGIYVGFVWTITAETAVDLTNRNPDADPDGDQFEALAWWDPTDLDNNPAVRTELAADLALVFDALSGVVKAANPKGGSTAWTGAASKVPQHQFDLRIIRHYQPLIAAAIAGLYSDTQVRDAITAATTTIVKAADPAAARAITAAVRNALAGQADTEALEDAIRSMIAEGYLTGAHAAATQTGGAVAAAADKASAGVDWSSWEPGDVGAALRSADGALADLLDSADITVKGIADTALDTLGDRIADGLLNGDSVDTVARNIRDLVDGDANRAQVIARTETARAQVAGSFDSYTEAGVTQFDWVLSDGACPECEAEADANPHDIGDDGPPEHPSCRCATSPIAASIAGSGDGSAVSDDGGDDSAQ